MFWTTVTSQTSSEKSGRTDIQSNRLLCLAQERDSQKGRTRFRVFTFPETAIERALSTFFDGNATKSAFLGTDNPVFFRHALAHVSDRSFGFRFPFQINFCWRFWFPTQTCLELAAEVAGLAVGSVCFLIARDRAVELFGNMPQNGLSTFLVELSIKFLEGQVQPKAELVFQWPNKTCFFVLSTQDKG